MDDPVPEAPLPALLPADPVPGAGSKSLKT